MSEPVASPILNDLPAGQTHLAPSGDSKDHVVSLTEPCWCAPTVQDEGSGQSTHIHHPIKPLMLGHTLELKKLHVTAHGVVELPR